MWFNLLKLDLSGLEQKIKEKPLGVEGKNIKIDGSDKCRKKLINFQNRILGMKDRNKKIFVDITPPSDLPEIIACQCVEKIDKFFNSMTSFSFPVEKEADEYHVFNDDYKLFIMHFSQNYQPSPYLNSPYNKHFRDNQTPVTVLLISIYNSDYWLRIILPKKEQLLMQAVKKHWEES